jgi:hypothetical protein
MLSLCLLAWALADKPAEPKPAEANQAQQAPSVIKIRVSPEAFPRAKDTADLMNLLLEDFKNQGKGIVDENLRKRIEAIMRRLPKEP